MTKLSELEACFRTLLDYARSRGVEGVDAGDRDLYWTVSSSEWRAIYEEPKPTVGSFADDELELRKMREDPSRACSVDLERLSNLLKLLSDSLVQ
jgi:hypothetical protein